MAMFGIGCTHYGTAGAPAPGSAGCDGSPVGFSRPWRNALMGKAQMASAILGRFTQAPSDDFEDDLDRHRSPCGPPEHKAWHLPRLRGRIILTTSGDAFVQGDRDGRRGRSG
jgi:hypothetical protein